MEQKRTVKSLISKRLDRNNFFLTILLIILSLVLCIGTATILTSYAGAADNSYTYDGFSYAGLDNKTEVLYRMTFVDPSDFEKTVNEIFIEDSSLYIGPRPVVVNLFTGSKNVVESGVYAHILGGIGNDINSKNITLIAGSSNTVSQKNDNATILGGEGNTVKNGKNNGIPLVSIGGKKNVAYPQHDGVALIGGDTNKTLGNNTSVFILGGEKNTVKKDRENIIVGGKKVTVDTDNIFVYSNVDDGFTPKSSNAFYLKMSNGVGINTEGKAGGLSVGGAVSVGEMNSSTFCTNDNLGLIVSYQGCLIGCTKAGVDNGQKWELLDKGDFCKGHYGNIFITSTENNETISKTYADAECTNNINTGYATPCFSGALGSYKNVVFESTLIDSTGSCPSEHSENKCVYKCNPGFHLAGSDGNKRCHADCAYEWKDGIIEGFYSGQQISGYSLNPVSCSSDSYTTGTPHPDTCTNHSKTLVCLSGTMYVSSGSSLTGGGVATNKLYYKNCAVTGYTCNTGVYNLSYASVSGNDTIATWNNVDRKTTTGNGGVYKLCLDYHTNNNQCVSNKSTEKHYQLIKCNSGYSTGASNPYVCKKSCTIKNISGSLVSYGHEKSITGYVSTGVTCTGTCAGIKLVCNDGDWRKLTLNGAITTGYQYNNCALKSKVCSNSVYNVSGTTYNQRSGTSIYESCEAYSASGNNCIHTSTTYRLVGCNSGYNAYGDHCVVNPECNTAYNGKTLPNLVESNNLCSKGNKVEKSFTYDDASYKWTWQCKNGNITVNCSATKDAECKGDAPEHAKFVVGSDENLDRSYQRMAYPKSDIYDDKGKYKGTVKCAYECENESGNEYVPYGGKCYKCAAGTRDPVAGRCTINVDCGDGYIWNGKKCERIGSCRLSNGQTLNNKMPSKNVKESWDDVVPIGADDKDWKCYDSRDSHTVQPHSCEYSCQEGYYCFKDAFLNGEKVACKKPYCESAPGDSSTYKTGGIPSLSQVDARGSQQIKFVNKDTESEFYSYVESNPGCWYRCPKDNRFKASWGTIYCYTLKHKAEAEAEANGYVCKNEGHYGYSYENKTTPTETYKEWKYKSSVSEATEACTWSCNDEAIGYAVGGTVNGEWKNYNNWFTCYKACGPDEYMDAICKKCPFGTIVDETNFKIFDDGTKIYLSCKKVECPDGFGLISDGKTCARNIGELSCPDGINGIVIDGACVTCLDPTKTITYDGECI